MVTSYFIYEQNQKSNHPTTLPVCDEERHASELVATVTHLIDYPSNRKRLCSFTANAVPTNLQRCECR